MADELFRIECFVDSKHLGSVMAALSGKVRNMSAPQLVINAKRKGNGLAAEVTPNVPKAEMVELFRAWLAKRKLKEINSHLGREFMELQGKQPGSYSLMFANAAEAGLLKKVGVGLHTRWLVRLSGRPAKASKKPKRNWAAEYAKRKQRTATTTTA